MSSLDTATRNLALSSLPWRTRRNVARLLPTCLEPLERALAAISLTDCDLTSPEALC